MDGNPITKPFCKDCKLWEPVGFYEWEREAHLEKKKCKHIKRCERVYILTQKDNQINLSDYFGISKSLPNLFEDAESVSIKKKERKDMNGSN